MGTFDDQPEDSPWRQLLVADALLADGRLTDAFAIYRAALGAAAVDGQHPRFGRADLRADGPRRLGGDASGPRGRLPAAGCAKRKALCEFRAGPLSRRRSPRRWPERIWNRGTGARAPRPSWRSRRSSGSTALPDSRERREVRATRARAERRYTDAIAELKAALAFAPGDPALLDDLGTRTMPRAITSRRSPRCLRSSRPTRTTRGCSMVYGDSLLQLQRVDEALPILQRAVEREPSDPTPRLALGRALPAEGRFRRGHSADRGAARRRPGRQPARAARPRVHRSRTEGQGRGAARAVAGAPARGPGARSGGGPADDHAAEISEFRSQLAASSSQLPSSSTV